MFKKLFILLLIIFAFVGWRFFSNIYSHEATTEASITFDIAQGESVRAITERLEEEGIVKDAWLLRKYLGWKGLDKDIRFGSFTFTEPITIASVAQILATPSFEAEQTITILPGWNLRDVAAYFVAEGIILDEVELYEITGAPAVIYPGGSAPRVFDEYPLLSYVPKTISIEGYLAPDTFNIFVGEPIKQVVARLVKHRNNQITEEIYDAIEASGRSVHEVMTLASLVESEVRGEQDRRMVADLFWRRYDVNMGLGADSSVHFIVGRSGSVFTTKADRDTDSLWNTYKYAGLPLGPISLPSMESIRAAINPLPNEYWYFLTDFDGNVHYGRNLDEHNANVFKYLR